MVVIGDDVVETEIRVSVIDPVDVVVAAAGAPSAGLDEESSPDVMVVDDVVFDADRPDELVDRHRCIVAVSSSNSLPVIEERRLVQCRSHRLHYRVSFFGRMARREANLLCCCQFRLLDP